MQGENFWRARASVWMREPLAHFLIAGLAVFLISSLRGEEIDPSSRTITINEEQVGRMAASWQQTWQRPPTPAEIDGLIRDHIKEEVYYREALRLGLDQDDTVIRRRLRAKMEFLATSQIENAPIDPKTLQAWFERNRERYAEGAKFSFDQIYLGLDAKSSSAASMEALRKGADWRELGETISLSRSLENASATDIDREFGSGFTAGLSKLPDSQWAGPITSGFGSHLIRIRSRQAGQIPELAKVRQRVENDWRAATLKAREAKAYQTLLDGYTIKIAKP